MPNAAAGDRIGRVEQDEYRLEDLGDDSSSTNNSTEAHTHHSAEKRAAEERAAVSTAAGDRIGRVEQEAIMRN